VWLAAPPVAGAFQQAAEAWHKAGHPFVVCRTRPGEEISLGFCLPPRTVGGPPQRIAASARHADVRDTSRPPELAEWAITHLPAIGAESAALARCGRVGLIGSRMWEAITGLRYTRPESDLDMVVDVPHGEVGAVASALQALASAAPVRVDAELSLEGFGEMHWEEWLSQSPEVLVKSLHGVRLVPRTDVPTLPGIARRFSSSQLAGLAVAALLEELALAPKPGLVSPVDSGSHGDMDHHLLRCSAEALREPFGNIAAAGKHGADFEKLTALGIAAETHMLEVTGGVNTHRGAIFCLGLFVAALCGREPEPPEVVRGRITTHWGRDLALHAARSTASHGAHAGRNGGLGGARGEAAAGFPSVFDVALPHLRRLVAERVSRREAAIETLFVLIAQAADTNLFHRGGREGMAFARQAALGFLDAGGVRTRAWEERARAIHHAFVARKLSPGGAADLLAATLLLHGATVNTQTSPVPARPAGKRAHAPMSS
jgi:triphosphoribosyl-dephospho-CoA synthase